MMNCPKCKKVSIDPSQCHSCGLVFSKYRDPLQSYLWLKTPRKKPLLKTEIGITGKEAVDLFLPVMVLVFNLIFNSPSFFFYGIRVWIHEFGHAFGAWWGGLPAVPLVGFTPYGSERTVLVTLFFSFLSLYAAWICWVKKHYFFSISFFGVFFAQFFFRFMPDQIFRQYCAYLGCGGEFWISTWMVMAYHYALPKKTYWHILRYIFLVAGIQTFLGMELLWRDVARGAASIPWGSAWGGDGDMDALSSGGWTEPRIIQSYLRLGRICIWVASIHYFFRIVKTLYTNSNPLDDEDEYGRRSD